MAGAGFKDFNSGDILTASDVDTYLMQQTVMVFDDAAARTTALTGVVAEGMMSYLKDTNKTYRYDGSAWLDDAGTTSPLTTKGDVWGYSTTDARIPIGADGEVLTADSTQSLGVKWAAAAAAGFSYTDYTPTFTNFTLGNGTITFSRYAQSGDVVHYYGKITLGSTSSVTGTWETSLPVNCKASTMGYGGTSFFYDNSAGTSYFGFTFVGAGGQTKISYAADIASAANAGIVNATTPFTWATSDVLTWNILYQVA
jgi:hypothetical protein